MAALNSNRTLEKTRSNGGSARATAFKTQIAPAEKT